MGWGLRARGCDGQHRAVAHTVCLPKSQKVGHATPPQAYPLRKCHSCDGREVKGRAGLGDGPSPPGDVRGGTKGLGGANDQAGHTGPLKGLAVGDPLGQPPVGTGQSSNSAPQGKLGGQRPRLRPLPSTSGTCWQRAHRERTESSTIRKGQDRGTRGLLPRHIPLQLTCHATKRKFASNGALPSTLEIVGVVLTHNHDQARPHHLPVWTRVK